MLAFDSVLGVYPFDLHSIYEISEKNQFLSYRVKGAFLMPKFGRIEIITHWRFDVITVSLLRNVSAGNYRKIRDLC